MSIPATPENFLISNYLTAVYQDWQASRGEFPHNTHPPVHWPIPFFGNPATARVTTIGVNPSSGEFGPARQWPRLTAMTGSVMVVRE